MGFRFFLSVLLLSSCFIINVFGGDIDQDHVTSSQETSHFVHKEEVLDHDQKVAPDESVDAEKDGSDTTKEEEYAPGELCLDREMNVSGRAVGCIGTVKLTSAIAELVTQYEMKSVEERRLRDRMSQCLGNVTAQSEENARLKETMKKLNDSTVHLLAEKEIEHQKVVDGLKKDLEAARVSYDNAICANVMVMINGSSHEQYLLELGLEEKISKFADNQASLKQIKDLYEVALVQNEMLHEELNVMVDLVTRRSGEESPQPLVEMKSPPEVAARHCGVVKGYEGCKEGLKVEEIEGYHPRFYHEYEQEGTKWQKCNV